MATLLVLGTFLLFAVLDLIIDHKEYGLSFHRKKKRKFPVFEGRAPKPLGSR